MIISSKVRRDGLAAIAVAATMLVEDAHETLTMAPADEPCISLPRVLGRLGAELTALAGAAAVSGGGK